MPASGLNTSPPPPVPAAAAAAWPEARGCVQCGRCTAGCPKAVPPELSPRRVMRLIQRGLLEEAARSGFLRFCRQCLACTARCPGGVDVAGAMRSLVWRRFLFD